MAKRRLNKEGSISYNRPKKLWVATIMHEGTRLFRYGATKKIVVEKLHALKKNQDDGMRLVSSSMPLGAYLGEWLELVKPSVRLKTYEEYESLIRVHLIPMLGHFKLNTLTPEQINRAWAQMLEKGHSASVIEHCHNRLTTALHHAVKRDLIAKNPIRFVVKPRVEVKEIHPLSPEQQWDEERLRWISEIDRVLEAAEATPYYALIHAAIHTGMRRNELLGLKWGDVNVDEAVIHVSRSLNSRSRGGKAIYQELKTKNSRRAIDLTPSSAVYLRGLWNLQKVNSVIHGYRVIEDSPVFIRETGELLLPSAVTHGFKKIVRMLGIEAVWFHDLRHTHATVMFRMGVHPKVVQERLGHANISTTLDIYSHYIPSLQKDAVYKFEEALENRVSMQLSP